MIHPPHPRLELLNKKSNITNLCLNIYIAETSKQSSTVIIQQFQTFKQNFDDQTSEEIPYQLI